MTIRAQFPRDINLMLFFSYNRQAYKLANKIEQEVEKLGYSVHLWRYTANKMENTISAEDKRAAMNFSRLENILQ